MDLAASAAFVAQPIETDAMERPPRSPKARFIDRNMLTNVSLAAISLSAAVLINCLLVCYRSEGLVAARSVAFDTWLVGHIFLAFNMRSQTESVFRVGRLSNKVVLLWAGLTFVFLLFVTNVPFAQSAIKVTYISAFNWMLVMLVPFVTIFWLELRRLAANRANRDTLPAKYVTLQAQHSRYDLRDYSGESVIG